MRTNRSSKALNSQRPYWTVLCQWLLSNNTKSHQQELYLIYVVHFTVDWDLYLWRFQNVQVSHCNSGNSVLTTTVTFKRNKKSNISWNIIRLAFRTSRAEGGGEEMKGKKVVQAKQIIVQSNMNPRLHTRIKSVTSEMEIGTRMTTGMTLME